MRLVVNNTPASSPSVRAREALRACLPEPLRDNTFSALLKVSGSGIFADCSHSYPSGRHGYEEMPHHPLEQPERAYHALTDPNRKQGRSTISPPFHRLHTPLYFTCVSFTVAIDCFASVPPSSLVRSQTRDGTNQDRIVPQEWRRREDLFESRVNAPRRVLFSELEEATHQLQRMYLGGFDLVDKPEESLEDFCGLTPRMTGRVVSLVAG